MAAGIAELMGVLPELLAVSQYAFYVFTVLFFGSIAVRGIAATTEWFVRWPLRLLFGALALVGGYALGPLVIRDGILTKLIQLDVLAAGTGVAVAYAAGLYLLSRGVNSSGRIRQRIARLEQELKQVEKRKGRSRATLAAGVVLIAAVAVVSVLLFRGVSNPAEELLAGLALPAGGGTGVLNATGVDLAKYCTLDRETLSCRIPLRDAGGAGLLP